MREVDICKAMVRSYLLNEAEGKAEVSGRGGAYKMQVVQIAGGGVLDSRAAETLVPIS